MNVAIYTRFSSDLQRQSSNEDQERRCRKFAVENGLEVVTVFTDREVSGATLTGREGLQALVTLVKNEARQFDGVLVDDTSRLARNIVDALKVIDTLKYHGIFVISVSQGIDSREKPARQLLTLHGMMDEQYLVGLADKVHRGQEGRVLNGLNPGGKCFGYLNIPIEDPTRQGKYGRSAISGVRLEPHPEEAPVVRRIFEMYAGGDSLAGIAKKLNAQGVPAPQPPKTRAMRAWCPSSIRVILPNERYRGIQVWNRTQKQRDPETGRKVSRRRPRNEWRRVEVPEWRLVPDEMWNAVQAKIKLNNERFGAARLGGFSRTDQSKTYLFSGLLICGACGSRMVIISGNGRRGYVKYGCPSHRYRGVCSNRLTIRRDRVEEQLLGALERRLVEPDMLDYMLKRFREQLDHRLEEIRRESDRLPELHGERQRLEGQAKRIADAIADAGHSPSLLAQLSSIESRLAQILQQIEAHQPMDLDPNLDEIREFVLKNVIQLRRVLSNDPGVAKAAILKHVGQLVLVPKVTASGPIYEVSGQMNILGDKDVMPVVARDGIEPPTPAFSGLDSSKAILLKSISLRPLPLSQNA